MHFIAVPERAAALAKAFGRTHADYARHFNLQHRSCGHVWQARFFSCPLQGAHLWAAMAYVERNPVRARLVERAEEYRWSSAAAHTAGQDTAPLLHMGEWRKQYTVERWREVLRTSVAEDSLAERLREATARGRPFGGEEFVDELERKAERRLRPLSAGRPRKNEEAAGDEQQCMQLRLGIDI